MQKTYITLTLTALILTGCIPILIGAGAGTGATVVAQDRTVGNAVDDVDIRIAINDQYLRNGNVGDLFRNVTVKVTEGRVLLTGDVDKPDSKIAATDLAWKVQGVKEVMNEIQVNDQTGVLDYAQDSWIANQVRSKLLFEKDLRSVNYNVEVVNQVVYLMGIAENQAELDKATYLASTTSHVKQVISHVILKNDPRRKQP